MKTITFIGDYWAKQLWCAHCGEEYKKVTGTHTVFEAIPATEFGPYEPAEYERVVWGLARRPDPTTHFIQANEMRYLAPPEHYVCDSCNAAIHPGDRCMARSLWNDKNSEPPAWEHEYLL